VQERRKEIIASQLAALAANMVIMLRSGHAIRQIINQSVLWAKQPLKKYLKNLSDELDTGIAFDPAMDNFSARCASKDASLITSALKINNRIGGNLIFVLDKITETLQENYKVKSNAKTLTLQARLSGNIIAAMPVAALSVMFLSMSSSISIFFQSRLGNIFLILGSVLEIAGILVIRKLLKTNL
jgi:tight adherence protein B